MKADLYLQGTFWATIDVPGDSLLALLANGLLVEAHKRANELQAELEGIDGIKCSIHMRVAEHVAFTPPNASHDPDQVAP